MFKTKSLGAKVLALGIVVTSLFVTSVTAMAVTNNSIQDEPAVMKTITVTEVGTVTEGEIVPLWLAIGPIIQYPNEGGTWEYGFWSAKVRSYYTVDRCHGSTVVLNGNIVRSVDTAPGKKSIAEKWAVQYPTHDDRYYYRVCD